MTETDRTGELTVDDPDGTVTVRKRVSKGERLVIDSGEETLKLDSLLLEGLSWQRKIGKLSELIEGGWAVEDDPVPLTGGEIDGSAGEISISNEYSHTTVRKVETDAGEAVRIHTPARGTAINLGAQSLRALAGVSDTFTFSVWFKKPFGPEDVPLEGPL